MKLNNFELGDIKVVDKKTEATYYFDLQYTFTLNVYSIEDGVNPGDTRSAFGYTLCATRIRDNGISWWDSFLGYRRVYWEFVCDGKYIELTREMISELKHSLIGCN